VAYFSEPGTTTEKAVYSDDGLTTPISQPITLNSEGRFPAPPYGSGEYRLQVYDSTDTGSRDGVLVFDEDNIRGATNFSDITLTAPLKADDSTSVAAPVYTFDGDLDTGISHPQADTVVVSTGGTEAVRITSAQRTGIGTTAPVGKLHVVAGARFEQSGGTADGAFVDILNAISANDRGIQYTGVASGRQNVLLAKETNSSTIVAQLVNGASWEWTQGSSASSAVMTLNTSSGNLSITGAISKGSGTFKIDHPLKPDTHCLVHSFIEGPRADLIYRGSVDLVDGEATVNLDSETGLSAGTFAALCRNEQVWLQNDTGWDAVKGSVTNGVLSITCESASSVDTVSWMVVAERDDDNIKAASWTDAEGHPILEPEK
jgi:hypothetical protein